MASSEQILSYSSPSSLLVSLLGSNDSLLYSVTKITFFATSSLMLLKYSRGIFQKIFARDDAFKKAWCEKNPHLDFTSRHERKGDWYARLKEEKEGESPVKIDSRTPKEADIDRQNNLDQLKATATLAIALFSAYGAYASWSHGKF